MLSVRQYFQRLPESSRFIILTIVYGLAGGLAAVAFELGINWIYVSTFVALSRHTLSVFLCGTFVVVVVCSLGGGFLLDRVDPSAAGSGIPQLKFAFWQDFGFVRMKTIIVKVLAGLLHVGGGMSLGREGPSIYIAGGVASQLSTLLGIPKQRRQRPAAAGAAAGLAAAFNTPLAAITFVLEEIVQDLNSRLVGSIILASVLGAFAVHAIVGKNPAFVLPQIEGATWKAYVGVPLAAAFASIVGIGFQRATMWLRLLSKSWKTLPRWMHPLFGGLVVWGLGVALFIWSGHLGVFGLGYDDLTALLHGHIPWLLVMGLLVAKWIATVACYGSGGCGGIFAPLLFLGAMARGNGGRRLGLRDAPDRGLTYSPRHRRHERLSERGCAGALHFHPHRLRNDSPVFARASAYARRARERSSFPRLHERELLRRSANAGWDRARARYSAAGPASLAGLSGFGDRQLPPCRDR